MTFIYLLTALGKMSTYFYKYYLELITSVCLT